MRTVVAAVVLVLVLAIGSGLLGRSLAPAAEGTVAVPASVAQPLPSRIPAAAITPVLSASRGVLVGVTAAQVLEDAARILTAASRSLDPAAAVKSLIPTLTLDGLQDSCAVGGPPACPVGIGSTVTGGGQPAQALIASAVVVPSGHLCGASIVTAPTLALTMNRASAASVEYWSAGGLHDGATIDAGTGLTCTTFRVPPLGTYTARVEVAGAGGVHDSRDLVFDATGAAIHAPSAAFAVTDDLVAVSVAHRPGDVVAIYPNVLNGDELDCDTVIAGDDSLVRPLGPVTATIDPDALAAGNWDPQFNQRTTFGFDIAEGLSVSFCAVVGYPRAPHPYYQSESIVRTADRLVPSFSVAGVSGLVLPDWTISGVIAGGQTCGTFRLPATTPLIHFEAEFAPSRTLCDLGDVLGTGPPDRVTLPLSVGERDQFTIEMRDLQSPVTRVSLDLGAAARCTGYCTVPRDSYYPVVGAHSSAVIRVAWSQRNSNGATATTVTSVSDSLSDPAPSAILDVTTSRIGPTLATANDGASARLLFRADGAVSYVASVIGACVRDGAVVRHSGVLAPGGRWSRLVSVDFTGLCAGADYETLIELTATDGSVTRWDSRDWGSGALLRTRAIPIALSIDVRVQAEGIPADRAGAAFVTLRADDQLVVGPLSGGCYGSEGSIHPAPVVVGIPSGDTIRFSGSVQSADADARSPCGVIWASSSLATTFAVDVALDRLLATPEGIDLRIDQDQTSAILHIAIAP